MNKNHFYIIMIIIAVLSASVFFYLDQKGMRHDSLAAVQKEQAPASVSVFPAPDKTYYQMQLYLDVETRTLYGTTVLTTNNSSGKDLQELWFTVYPNCFRNSADTPAPPEAYYAGFNEGWLEFDSFKVNGRTAEISGQGAGLRVKPAATVLANSDLKIEMNWKVKIPRLMYRFGSKDMVYMLGNFYPTLNVLSEDGWHNSYNSGFGDPFCFHTADYQVTVNIPTGYNFVSSGKTVDAQAEDDGRETYLVQAENARDFCLLVMYDYTEIEEKIKGTTIKCYFAGQNNRPEAEQILKQTARIVDYYACQFGSYPYEELKTIFIPMQGFHGMEYSGLIFLQEGLLNSDAEKQRSEFILAHEIAHQWWYGMVGNDQLREPWLDEGLANWSAYQFLHEVEGQSLPASSSSKGMNLAKELSQMNSRQDYYLTAYRGGEAFWFGLEKQLGHEAVIKVLRHYLADYRFKIATTHDLIGIIETEAHQNMDDYIYQWFPPE